MTLQVLQFDLRVQYQDRKENCKFVFIFFSQQTASASYSTDDAPLTVGEVIGKHLDIKQIGK